MSQSTKQNKQGRIQFFLMLFIWPFASIFFTDGPCNLPIFLTIAAIFGGLLILPNLQEDRQDRRLRIGSIDILPICIVTFFISPILTIFLYFGARDALITAHIKSFEPYLSEYTNIPNLKQSNQTPYINGKFIIIDKAYNEIDKSIDPYGGTAEKPEELGTIIWLECKEFYVGNYTKGSRAYEVNCDVTVLDKANASIVDKKNFIGSPLAAKLFVKRVLERKKL